MIDTLKIASVGGVGFMVQFMESVPEIIKISIGLVTLCYLVTKIWKEYR
tara:strand:- start:548 stop:694 length:147 start_codon:yes stop_codon:yes gene_type:complete